MATRRWLVGLLAAFLLTASTGGAQAPTLGPGTAEAAPAAQAPCEGWVLWDQAWRCVGSTLWVAGLTVCARHLPWVTGGPTFLDLGRCYPDPARFAVVIWREDRPKFWPPPEQAFPGRNTCAYGTIATYAGVPQIIAREPWQLRICE
jgi:hypothetical protein